MWIIMNRCTARQRVGVVDLFHKQFLNSTDVERILQKNLTTERLQWILTQDVRLFPYNIQLVQELQAKDHE